MQNVGAKTELTKAKTLAEAINKEVFRAIALRSSWVRCANSKDVLTAINGAKLIAFNVIREAIHKDLVFTMTKLFDVGKDDLSFHRIFRILEDPAVLPLLADAQACAEANARYRAVADSKHCRSLRLLRNKMLAHNDTRGVQQTAKYGHEVALLKDTVWITTRLSTALPAGPFHYEAAERVWDDEANRFWMALIQGSGSAGKVLATDGFSQH